LEEKRRPQVPAEKSNAFGDRRISAFVIAFEPTERFSNSCGQKSTEMLLNKTIIVSVLSYPG